MTSDIELQEILDQDAEDLRIDDIDFDYIDDIDDIDDYEWDMSSEEPDVERDLVDGLTDLIDGMFVESRY